MNVPVAVHRVDSPLAPRPSAAASRRSSAFRSGPSKFLFESMWEERSWPEELERRAEPAGYTAPLVHTVTRRKVTARVRATPPAPRIVTTERAIDHESLPVLWTDDAGHILAASGADSADMVRYLAYGSSIPTFGPAVILRTEGTAGAIDLPYALAA